MLFLANFVFPDSIQMWNLFFFIGKNWKYRKIIFLPKNHSKNRKLVNFWVETFQKLIFVNFRVETFQKLIFVNFRVETFQKLNFVNFLVKILQKYCFFNDRVEILEKFFFFFNFPQFLIPAIKAFLSKFCGSWFKTGGKFIFSGKKVKKYRRIAFFTKKSLLNRCVVP